MYAPPDQYIQQSAASRRPLLMWSIVAAGSLAVVALIVGAPLALATGHALLSQPIYQAFSYVCHQIPDRSFFIAGHQFAVCARCTGIYAGFTAATLFYPLVKSLRQIETPARKWLFLAAAPLAIDFSLTFLGIWNNTHFSRFATGALLGIVSVFYVMPGLLDLSLREWRAKGKVATATSANTAANNAGPVEIFPPRASTAPSDYSAPHRRI
ncbi:MAG: DUF2085 domain-containing protein [Acidobacteriota bacterium]|nr:DUF2085 domain-containing protein [Acidobacteriota bacterium]